MATATKQPSFVERHPNLEDRKAQATKILASYPDKLPVICEPSNGSELTLDRTKFLIPNDFQAIQFQTLIRKRMQLGK